jgi:hypothetical protein
MAAGRVIAHEDVMAEAARIIEEARQGKQS